MSSTACSRMCTQHQEVGHEREDMGLREIGGSTMSYLSRYWWVLVVRGMMAMLLGALLCEVRSERSGEIVA
jgi:hypothetical protein